MNDKQRKQIMAAQLEIGKQKGVLENVMQENQDAFDNLPEGLQQGEKGQAMEEAIGYLEEACNALDECDNALSNF